MAAPIIVRSYETSDLDAVIDIFLRAIREIASRDYNAAQIHAWAQADRDAWSRRRLDRPTWVAIIDENLAGFSDLERDGHIDMLFVNPDYQRRGVANALLDRIEQQARGERLSLIHTDASITARPFFHARGFETVRTQAVDLRGTQLTNFRMQKQLPLAV